jgi:hypothetical protein
MNTKPTIENSKVVKDENGKLYRVIGQACGKPRRWFLCGFSLLDTPVLVTAGDLKIMSCSKGKPN